jgi:hypothetical protein
MFFFHKYLVSDWPCRSISDSKGQGLNYNAAPVNHIACYCAQTHRHGVTKFRRQLTWRNP